jgi:hypothetical protein
LQAGVLAPLLPLPPLELANAGPAAPAMERAKATRLVLASSNDTCAIEASLK